jgi:hypothetical protein
MALHCPKCSSPIPLFQIRTAFRCRSCRHLIHSNHGTLMWVVLPLCIAAEVALFFLFRVAFGGAEVAFLAWSFVGGVTAILMYWFLVTGYAKLQVAE